jgi:hypothetical protein
MKRVFQIVHQNQEIHNIQSYSIFDKNAWLSEAENIRSKYCRLYYDIETAYSRTRLLKYKYQVLAPKPSEIDTSSVRASSFFFRRKVTESTDGSPNSEEEFASRRASKRQSAYNPPNSAPLEKPETKITAQELLIAKNRLSHIPSRSSLLFMSGSFRNLNLRNSPESTLPRPVQITPVDLLQAKQHLSPTKTAMPVSPLARSALHAEIVKSPRRLLEKTNSATNLIEKIKKTFRNRSDFEESIIQDAIQISE